MKRWMANLLDHRKLRMAEYWQEKYKGDLKLQRSLNDMQRIMWYQYHQEVSVLNRALRNRNRTIKRLREKLKEKEKC